MKKLLIILFSILLFGTVQAQQNTFSKVLADTTQGIQGYAISPAFDGGYIIAGENAWYSNNGFVLKVDSSGSPVWNREFVKPGRDGAVYITFSDITSTYDSCFVLVGRTYYFASNHTESLLVKILSDGDTLWTKTITAGEDIFLESVVQTCDSGFIVSGIISNSSLFIAKLDETGTIQWSKSYDLGESTVIRCSVKQLVDSSYIAIGAFNYGGSFLVKLSKAGSSEWSKRYYYSDSYGDIKFQDCLANDSLLLLYGAIHNKLFLINSTDSGNINWVKSYNYYFGDSYFLGYNYKLHRTSDNGYVFVWGGFEGGNVIKTDSAGNVDFSNIVIMNTIDVIETENSEFFVLGLGPLIGVKRGYNPPPEIGFEQLDSLGGGGECTYSSSVTAVDDSINSEPISVTESNFGYNSTVSIAIDTLDVISWAGCVDITSSVDENLSGNEIKIYPNPSKGDFSVQLGEAVIGDFTVFNILGQKVFEKRLINKKNDISLPQINSGIYFYNFVTSNKRVASGIVLISN